MSHHTVTSGDKASTLACDIKRMLPVWLIVFATAAGALIVIRYNGVRYLERGLYAQADTCAVADIYFESGMAVWRDLAAQVAKNPTRGELHGALGELEGTPKLDEARQKFLQAIEICPRQQGPNNALASIEYWDGNEALSHYYLAQEHLLIQEYDMARIELETAWDLDSENSDIVLALANVCTRQKRWDDVEQYLESSGADARDSAEGLLIRGTLAFERKQFEESLELLRQSLELEPGRREAIDHLINIYAYRRDAKEGADWMMENLKSAKAPYAGSYHRLEILYTDLKEFESALDAIERALALSPNNVRLLLEKAYCLYSLDRKKEAKQVTEMAINRDYNAYSQVLNERRFGIIRDLDETP